MLWHGICHEWAAPVDLDQLLPGRHLVHMMGTEKVRSWQSQGCVLSGAHLYCPGVQDLLRGGTVSAILGAHSPRHQLPGVTPEGSLHCAAQMFRVHLPMCIHHPRLLQPFPRRRAVDTQASLLTCCMTLTFQLALKSSRLCEGSTSERCRYCQLHELADLSPHQQATQGAVSHCACPQRTSWAASPPDFAGNNRTLEHA